MMRVYNLDSGRHFWIQRDTLTRRYRKQDN